MTLSEDHDAKVLIVVFNKRLERELSAKIFDDNITVITFHSIAYRAMKVTGSMMLMVVVKMPMPTDI